MRELKEVPQIDPLTGLSRDYLNEYTVISTYFKSGLLEKVAKTIAKRPIKKYIQRFPETKYANVINGKNRLGAETLDNLADLANAEFEAPLILKTERLPQVVNEVCEIIAPTRKKPFTLKREDYSDLVLDYIESQRIEIGPEATRELEEEVRSYGRMTALDAEQAFFGIKFRLDILKNRYTNGK